ncbi:MAG: hypothetical protein U0800_10390 [Isosphaeraceae bacterium]
MIGLHGLGRTWLAGAAALILMGSLPGRATAQQSTLDPYKPYVRGYQAFADPGATVRPGFPNPLGGSGRPTYGNIFDPNGMGYGGIDPFAPPYYNRFQNPSQTRGSSLFQRSLQDLSNRPERLVDPQERLDREFYEQIQKRDDPYLKLQEKRDDLYFRALQETDPARRAELMKAFQKASQRSAAAFSTPRRFAATPSTTPRRDMGTGAGASTPPRAAEVPNSRRNAGAVRPSSDRPDSLKDAIERSDREDRANGQPPPASNPPSSSARRAPGS